MESTLSLTKAELEVMVADFLGWGPGTQSEGQAWEDADTNKVRKVRELVKAGVHRFYYPFVPGMLGTYEWSFLQPVAALTFASDATTVELPDDYGGLHGKITVSTSDSATFIPLEFVHEGVIRAEFAKSPDASGRPMLASEQVLKGTETTRGQRFQLYLFPAADQDYTLTVPYKITPNALTGLRPICYGGAWHAETIRESCLAVAEHTLYDKAGIHTELFNQRLLASIGMDQAHKPHKLGYNADHSHGLHNSRFERQDVVVTVNGVTP